MLFSKNIPGIKNWQFLELIFSRCNVIYVNENKNLNKL